MLCKVTYIYLKLLPSILLALAHLYEAYIMPLNYNVLNSSKNNLSYAKDITCKQQTIVRIETSGK